LRSPGGGQKSGAGELTLLASQRKCFSTFFLLSTVVGVCGFHVLRPRAYPSSENENDEQGINATNCFRFLAAGVWYSLGRFISFPLKEGKDNNCDDAVVSIRKLLNPRVATTTAPASLVAIATTLELL